ncbi:hypothetical protein BDR04DRAFT_1150932 [Suillus decipiens]|nr:hypothetical protein BDR04DRAFT_1150932 [Suillus decipiens]
MLEEFCFSHKDICDPYLEREPYVCPPPSHLAEGFALREAPKTIPDGKNEVTVSKGRGSHPVKLTKQHDGWLSKRGGKISSGTDEFQIPSGVLLDSLVHG